MENEWELDIIEWEIEGKCITNVIWIDRGKMCNISDTT